MKLISIAFILLSFSSLFSYAVPPSPRPSAPPDAPILERTWAYSLCHQFKSAVGLGLSGEEQRAAVSTFEKFCKEDGKDKGYYVANYVAEKTTDACKDQCSNFDKDCKLGCQKNIYDRLAKLCSEQDKNTQNGPAKNEWLFPNGEKGCCFAPVLTECSGANAFSMEVKDESGISFFMKFSGEGGKVAKASQMSTSGDINYDIVNGKVYRIYDSRNKDIKDRETQKAIVNYFMKDFNERLKCCQNEGEVQATCLSKYNADGPSAGKSQSGGRSAP